MQHRESLEEEGRWPNSNHSSELGMTPNTHWERKKMEPTLPGGRRDTKLHSGDPVQQMPQDTEQEDAQNFTTGEKQN